MLPSRTTQLNHNIHRHALPSIARIRKVISEIRSHAETRREPRVQRGTPVLDAAIDVEGVGEDDGFGRLDGGRDALRVVEPAHRGDEFERIAAVLAGAAEDLGVGCWGLRVRIWGGVGVGVGVVGAVVLRLRAGGANGRVGVGDCVFGAVAGEGGGGGEGGSGAGAGGGVDGGVFAEGFEEGGRAEGVR